MQSCTLVNLSLAPTVLSANYNERYAECCDPAFQVLGSFAGLCKPMCRTQNAKADSLQCGGSHLARYGS
jgi:hypothetical protein